MIVYLDLDRTLFRTTDMDTVWSYIGTQYPEAVEAFDSAEEYFHYVGEQYYYDMSAHLSSLGLEPENIYASVTASELADGRLEADGAGELIKGLEHNGYDVAVLTFGTDDYQKFKASLCPSLRQVPIVTTLRAKADILEELGEECWLVDDRPLGDELPGNVSFVQLCEERDPTRNDASWTVKKSLYEVKEFFDAISH